MQERSWQYEADRSGRFGSLGISHCNIYTVGCHAAHAGVSADRDIERSNNNMKSIIECIKEDPQDYIEGFIGFGSLFVIVFMLFVIGA